MWIINSFEKAKADGYRKFIMFIHYPVTNVMEKDSVFTRIASEYNVSEVIYGHIHGKHRFNDSLLGELPKSKAPGLPGSSPKTCLK